MIRVSNLGAPDIEHRMVLVRHCAVHDRVFNSILGLYPLDASSVPTKMSPDNQNCLQTLPNVPGWGPEDAVAKSPQIGNH